MRSAKLVDFQDHDGVSPLMLAAKVGWSEGVVTLLREDASLELKDNAGRTARMHAEAKGHRCDMTFVQHIHEYPQQVIRSCGSSITYYCLAACPRTWIPTACHSLLYNCT